VLALVAARGARQVREPAGGSPGGWSVPPPPFNPAPREPFLLRRAVLVPLTALVFFGVGYAVGVAATVAGEIDFDQVFEDLETGSSDSTSIEGVQRFGDLTISHTRVREDFAGDFEVLIDVENRGDDRVGVTIEAFLLQDDRRVGEVSATESFDSGESREVQLTGLDDYVDTFEDIEFNVEE